MVKRYRQSRKNKRGGSDEPLGLIGMKNIIQLVSDNISRFTDKTDPKYDQQKTDKLYNNLVTKKQEIVNAMPNVTGTEKDDLEALLKDVDKLTTIIEEHASNEALGMKSGGRRMRRMRRKNKTKRRKSSKRRTNRR